MHALNEDAIQVENLKIRATLARGVRDTLDQNHLTQTEAAERLGISQPRISALLKGWAREFRLDAMVNMALKRKPFTNIRCDHVEFRQSKYAAPLRRMNYLNEGKMKPNGILEAAQKDHRLHKTDGHFYLDSFSVVINGGGIKTTWSVKSIYDFEPFEKKDYYTEIPLGDFKLILPDGLSEYMTRIGVAKVFHYSAEWQETWSTAQ